MTATEQADEFLASCLRNVLARKPSLPWPDDWHDPAIHETVAQRSEFHGIAVLLHQSGYIFEGWPEDVAGAVQTEARLAGLWEEIHRHTIADLIGRLARESVPTLIMKGTALAYLYHDDPATRRRGDTDLLIHREDLDRTRAVLEAVGAYRRSDPHGLFFQETWLIERGAQSLHSVDLHWQPADRPVLQKILRSQEFWAGSTPVPRLSPDARAPDPMLMLVHGAINQLWHTARGFFANETSVKGGRRLIWSFDYARLTAGFDEQQWDRLIAFCRDRDISVLMHEALDGAQRDLSFNLPDGVLDRLAQDRRPSRAYLYVTTPDHLRDMWTDIQTSEKLSQKVHILRSLILPPRSHLERKYPDAHRWPTFLLYLRRLGAGVSRLLSGESGR